MTQNKQHSITIVQPDDWHLHLRDGGMLEDVVADSARQFGRAIIMPNLKPPVTTTEQALNYRQRILDALTKTVGQSSFDPLMTLYLTDSTPAEEIKKAHESGLVYAVKLYPAGATTNSSSGVTDVLKHCSKTLEMMQKLGMPMLIHGEVTDPSIDIFDREAVFIDRVMDPVRQAFPGLKIVFEHVTTADGVDYVKQAPGPIGATITPQHLLYNRNAIFQGGLRPHWYCLPVLKREGHRAALVEAATSGHDRFFLGTDSAPHPKGHKEQDHGCAGCYSARYALSYYASVFDQQSKLENLEAFASLNGAKFYNLPANQQQITLRRTPFTIEPELQLAHHTIVPLAAEQALSWQVV